MSTSHAISRNQSPSSSLRVFPDRRALRCLNHCRLALAAVTDGPPELPQLPLKLPLLALIGLSNPEQGDWATLRALQYGQIYRLQRGRGIAQAVAVAITISIFFGKAPTVYSA